MQRRLPFLMRSPLVSAFPVQVGLIAKPSGKKSQELAPAERGFGSSLEGNRSGARGIGKSAHCNLSFDSPMAPRFGRLFVAGPIPKVRDVTHPMHYRDVDTVASGGDPWGEFGLTY
jgi:hypothetical protein